ncbi:zinc finger protein OZF isoform X2 [Nematostella vectensis]|uniref:zinc finger protein OZF isoform X2 n=1 Tax=Nematostella vectensis TaxID=45351 RepID=UPI0013900594|nr:zinc finger protein OZF isoform X2 [Nematostella vectensis]XP_048578714.1 zinc finger protein OZF isoform X2 [Nematostella vectensis]XP_048578716.1 zinc finger protein OZF isoform X2 [Nematostella vectensis]
MELYSSSSVVNKKQEQQNNDVTSMAEIIIKQEKDECPNEDIVIQHIGSEELNVKFEKSDNLCHNAIQRALYLAVTENSKEENVKSRCTARSECVSLEESKLTEAHGSYDCVLQDHCYTVFGEIDNEDQTSCRSIGEVCEFCGRHYQVDPVIQNAKCTPPELNKIIEKAKRKKQRVNKCKKCGVHVSGSKHSCSMPFQCKDCDMCFAYPRELIEHSHFHTGKMPFSCKKCYKCFKDAKKLKAHKKEHKNEKSCQRRLFQCETCGKCFMKEKGLLAHMEIHNNDDITEGKQEADTTGSQEIGTCIKNNDKIEEVLNVLPDPSPENDKTIVKDRWDNFMRVSQGIQTGKYIELNTDRVEHRETADDTVYMGKAFESVSQGTQTDKVVPCKCEILSHPENGKFGQSNLLECQVCGKCYMREKGLRIHMETCHKMGNDTKTLC